MLTLNIFLDKLEKIELHKITNKWTGKEKTENEHGKDRRRFQKNVKTWTDKW